MKKITTLVLIAFMVLLNNQAFAQKLIALQSGDKATFYTDLDTALYYAKNGDDIYLPGGYIKANSTTLKIDKAVNIIGVGYNPYTNAATENTIIQSQTIQIMPYVNGGSITGIFTINCTIQILETVDNFSVNRCLFSSIIFGNYDVLKPPFNISITESVVENGIINMESYPKCPQNVSITNSIIGNLNGAYPFQGNQFWDNITCRNCLILGKSTYGYPIIIGIKSSLFENCILMDANVNSNLGCNNSIFRNCLFTGSGAELSVPAPNLVYNCIFNQPQHLIFVDPQDFVFNMKNDYRLRDDSPGKNAGKDGTDIGIYGGRYPWKDGGLPVNPHIETFNVAGKTDSIGNLKVKIKVAAQEN